MSKKQASYAPRKPLIETSIGWAVSFDEACKITMKSERTIHRWIKEGWPPAYFNLVKLYAEGRVMPDRWKHSFFNRLGCLEIQGLNEDALKENDILNMHNLRRLNHSFQNALKMRISDLEKKLADADSKIEQLHDTFDAKFNTASANDRVYQRGEQ